MLPVGVVIGYVAVLAASGLVLVVLGGIGAGQGVGARAVEILVGMAFLAYAGYLVFVFEGGRVGFSLWVLVAPILAIANVARVRRQRRIQDEQLAATYEAEAAEREWAARQAQARQARPEPQAPRNDG
jgi:hypothetical protein